MALTGSFDNKMEQQAQHGGKVTVEYYHKYWRGKGNMKREKVFTFFSLSFA